MTLHETQITIYTGKPLTRQTLEQLRSQVKHHTIQQDNPFYWYSYKQREETHNNTSP